MSNNVQSHDQAADLPAGDDRRADFRHAALALGSVTARIIGGSQVDLVNFSSRGVLFECDSRLLIGARASVRITTPDANLIVTGRVVRSRVKGLVNGALRYDAALVLDSELALASAFVKTLPTAAFDAEEMAAFESDLDASLAPSPVEAYVAESEASLLDVASGADLAGPASLVLEPVPPFVEPTSPAIVEVSAAEDIVVSVTVDQPPPLPSAYVPAVDDAPAVDDGSPDAFAAEADATAEPIAFESDDIAFEPEVEFAFDEAGLTFEAPGEAAGVETSVSAAPAAIEQAAAEDAPAASMFDSTYIPPADEIVPPSPPQFEVTPPRPVHEATTSSFFDSRPSHTFGGAPTPPEADVPADSDAENGVAFEAEDVVFEAAFDEMSAFAASAIADEPAAPEAVEAHPIDLAPMPPAVVDEVAAPETFDAATAPDTESEERTAQPAAQVGAEDRVLAQFAATVPQDLAELGRIAADNQW